MCDVVVEKYRVSYFFCLILGDGGWLCEVGESGRDVI